MKKVLLLLLVLMTVFTGAVAEETVIFVATDRHAAYETVKAEETPSPEETLPPQEESSSKEKKLPRARQIPVYDENGNLIWHNNLTEVLKQVKADGVVPQLVLLGGDFVGSGGDGGKDVTGYPLGAPYFSMTAVDAQVQAVFGGETRTLYTYGSHDANAVDEYGKAFFSGPVDCGDCHIYSISFSQMIHDTDRQAEEKYKGKDLADERGLSAQRASEKFLAWVNSLEDHLPIIVMSHVPLHAHRGDNLGGWTWTRALNAAAQEHDVIFLWGHNHTMENREDGRETERAHYVRLPGEELTAQSWETDEEGKETGSRIVTSETGEESKELITRTEKLRFVYLNAGYIINGVGTVLSFRDGQMTVKRYALNEEESAEPWTYDLLFPQAKDDAA